jgi:hypothetical protein
LRSSVGHRASAQLLLRDPSCRYVRTILLSHQIVPWCRVYTEARYVVTFNEAGWDATYLRAAELRAHTELWAWQRRAGFTTPNWRR